MMQLNNGLKGLAIISALLLASDLSAGHVKIYVLAGQSNAAGDDLTSNFNSAYTQPRSDIEFWYSGTQTDFVPLQTGTGNKTTQSGPELTLGHRLKEEQTSANIALIKQVVSGSSIYTHWDTTSTNAAFSKMVAKVEAAQQVIIDRGDTYEMAGMFWWQGESDVNATGAPGYENALGTLISASRTAFGDADMPFVAALLPFYYGGSANNAILNQGIKNAVQAAGDADYIGLDDTFLKDVYHYQAHVYEKTGFRAANTIMALEGIYSLSSPVTVDDVYHVGKNTPLEVTRGGGCLVNDSDADSQQLMAELVTQPTNGALQDLGGGVLLNDLGEFTYVPGAGFTGTDSFTYRVKDKNSTGSVATVSINVLEPGSVDTGLQIYWDMEGSVTDQAPAGQNPSGTLNGGASIGDGGVVGQKLGAGQNKYVTLSGGSDMAPPWSISYWVKRTGDVIKEKTFLANGNNRLLLGAHTRTERAGILKGSKRYFFDYKKSGGVWRHFVMINNGSTIQLYANGVPLNSLDVSLSLPLAGTIGLNAKESVNGSLDEVAVWNRVLNTAEITSLHYRGNAGLAVTATIEAGVPTANAGPDQAIPDSDGLPGETILLDGAASFDPDGTITSYVWTVGAAVLASGTNQPVNLADGPHAITLTVTDNDGKTAVDTLNVFVEPPHSEGITTLFGTFITPAGLSSSVSGTRTILGDTWNDVLLSTTEPVQNIAPSILSDSAGNASPYTFAAVFNGQQDFLVGAANADSIASGPEWNWYNDAKDVDTTVAVSPRVDNNTWTASPIGTVFTVYTLGGFETNDSVALDFVLSRTGSSTGVRRTGAIADGTDLGIFGPGLDQQFSVILSGKTSYAIELYSASAGSYWGPLGNAFRLSVTPYEYVDSDQDGMPDAWEIANGLNTNANDSAVDTDGDGQNNLNEYNSGTDPRSTASVFRVTDFTLVTGGEVQLIWNSASGFSYSVWGSTDLSNWVEEVTGILASSTTATHQFIPSMSSTNRAFMQIRTQRP